MVRCPKCGITRNTAFCGDCGIKLEPLRALLGYCAHRSDEYERRVRRLDDEIRCSDNPDDDDPGLRELYGKWSAYVERLTAAIGALEQEEANG